MSQVYIRGAGDNIFKVYNINVPNMNQAARLIQTRQPSSREKSKIRKLAKITQIARTSTRGGIDFAESNLDMQIKRDGKGVVLPMSQQNLDNIRIDGLVPEILAIKPAQGLLQFLKEAQNP